MKKVLLVEDDAFIRDLTSIKLTEQSFAVLVAHDGNMAVSMLHDEKPDIVLLDLDLPDMSGLEVLKHMKEDQNLMDTPVIIFSNNDDPKIKAQALELGSVDFFVKATTAFEDLLKRIQERIGA
jgi:DNA-binding response OmpR family regulator